MEPEHLRNITERLKDIQTNADSMTDLSKMLSLATRYQHRFGIMVLYRQNSDRYYWEA